MCQQTRVQVVIPYFERWMTAFPTVNDLAEAESREVMALWQGLGYYRRAKMLHEAAKIVVETGWPVSAKGWKKLPGIGEYTSAAISSITLGQEIAAVDGNVERVFARLNVFNQSKPEITGKARNWSQALIPPYQAGTWNQALMELGALICLPKSPRCQECPISQDCRAFKNGEVDQYPVRSSSADIRHLTFLISVIEDGEGRIGVQKGTHPQWWQGLYELPWQDITAQISRPCSVIGEFDHMVTNHRIRCMVIKERKAITDIEWVAREDLDTIPLSSLARKALAIYFAATYSLLATSVE